MRILSPSPGSVSFPMLVSVLVSYCRVVNSTKCRGLREHMLLVFQQEAGRGLSGSLASGFLTGLQQRYQPTLRSPLKA